MITFIMQTQAPSATATWHGQDMLLALASLELNPQLVLLGDALAQLQHGKDVTREQRSLQKRYGLLGLYDCPAPLVIEEDLLEHGLSSDDFVSDVRIISRAELLASLSQSTKVMRF